MSELMKIQSEINNKLRDFKRTEKWYQWIVIDKPHLYSHEFRKEWTGYYKKEMADLIRLNNKLNSIINKMEKEQKLCEKKAINKKECNMMSPKKRKNKFIK